MKKAPLRIYLIIAIMFFLLFSIFSFLLPSIFYFKDSKRLNYAPQLYGELVITAIDPINNNIITAQPYTTETNPLFFSFPYLEDLIHKIEAVDGVNTVLPRSQFYNNINSAVQINNSYSDKSIECYLSAISGTDISKLSKFYENQKVINVPNIKENTGTLINSTLASFFKENGRTIKDEDIIEITNFSLSTGIKIPYLGTIECADIDTEDNTDAVENFNKNGLMTSIPDFEKLSRILSPVYKSYTVPPSSLSEVEYKNITDKNAKRVNQGLTPSILQIRIENTAEKENIKKEIQNILNEEFNKIGDVKRIVIDAKDFAIGEDERIILEANARNKFVLCSIALIMTLIISSIALNEHFKAQYPTFALKAMLGQRDSKLISKILFQNTFLIIPEAITGVFTGLVLFLQYGNKQSFLVDTLFYHILISCISILITAIVFCTTSTFYNFKKLPLSAYLSREVKL